METSLDSTPIAKTQSSQRQTTPFGFVQKRLPWLIAAAFLVVYSLTLARWVSYQGLATLARAAGWDWQLTYHEPLQFLITYPVRWLPPGWQVVFLNLFSAICSVLTLALLARSVAILPHDRTRDQRQLERNEFSFLSIPMAWLPPIFAVLVCGLQLTFWEHSIVSTGEAFDLLLFAYCVRCLLEYRLDQRNSWLYRIAPVMGLAMTSNFAMIGFLPAFVIATLWIKKRSFFNIRFLVTMTSLGLAGLLLFLLLPAINSSSPLTDQSFWELLKVSVGYQKSQVLGFPRYIALLAGLTSVLPILFIGIKWPNQLGDISAVGVALTNLMTHVIHAVFMLACLYVAFDPPFSPRALAFGQQPMLPFYYLGALSAGYFAGYFLLVFGHATLKPWERYRQLRRIANKAIVALVCLAAVGVPTGLVVKNLPEIRKTNGPYLARMGDSLAKSLPPEGGVVLSDDLPRLYIVHDALRRNGTLDRYILVHTAALERPAYQRYLQKKYGQRWPGQLAERPLKSIIKSPALVNIALILSQSQRLFYLHPTFGYYVEYFYLQPRNLAYELKRYPPDALEALAVSADVMKDNDAFWRRFIAQELPALRQPKFKAAVKKRPQGLQQNLGTSVPAAMYSRGLTWLGVEAQKAGQLDAARDYFNAALELNPENPSAFVSLDFNALLREGKTESTKHSEGAIERIAKYGGGWQQIMALNGPVDDPIACQILAQIFTRGGSFRQAAQYLSRLQALNPKALEPRMLLAGVLVQARMPDKALALIEQIRNEPKDRPTPVGALMTLIQSEAWAYVYKNDLATAEKVLNAADAKYPGDDTPFSTLIEIYFRNHQTDRAVALLERELSRNPNHSGALINYAAIKMQGKEYEAAIAMLDRALKAAPDDAYALLNRAIANLQLGRLDDARRDYEHIMSKQSRVPHVVHYGLGEIAWRKKLSKPALEHYGNYLKTAPASPEREEVERRVKRLKAGGSF
jgi:tetratricopeptide (TPR) repeat protein